MPETFTNKLEQFFDNNTPGGYIQTSVSISDNDLDQIINNKINNIFADWAKAPTKPTYTAEEVGAIPIGSGNGNANVSISNVLSSGTRLATITINGQSTNINSGPATQETDPIFNNSPAANITNNDITIWNNKSEFSGDYNDLSSLPKPIKEININENNGYASLGITNFYIQNADMIRMNLADDETPYFITNLIQDYYNNFIVLHNTIDFFVTNIDSYIEDGGNNNEFYTLTLTPFNYSNYLDIKDNVNNEQELLDSLDIYNYNIIIIYDAINKTLYSKMNEIIKSQLITFGDNNWNFIIGQINSLQSQIEDLRE